MRHGHPHSPGHPHNDFAAPVSKGADLVFDLSVSDTDLCPAQVARRGFLRRAGLMGVGIAGASVPSGLPRDASADERQKGRRAPRNGYSWLAGDHHIHTQNSTCPTPRCADRK